MMEKPRRKDSPGPPPGRVKVNKTWEQAIKDALQKKRPKDGWPKPEKKKDRGT
jgi:hypothetical protein